VQPDTLIPDAYNPQSYNRYMYAFGNPVNTTDPTGHDPKDDPCSYYGYGTPECSQDDPSLPPSKTTIGPDDNTTIVGGERAIVVNVISYSDMANYSLSTSAQESYDGAGGTPELNYNSMSPAPFGVAGAASAAGAAEDFNTNKGGFMPVAINVTWQLRTNGLEINNINVINSSKTTLVVSGMGLYPGAAGNIELPGSSQPISPGHQTMLNVNQYTSNSSNTTLKIFVVVHNGDVSFNLNVNFFPGLTPPPGCASPIFYP
jgi:hypothetical protein